MVEIKTFCVNVVTFGLKSTIEHCLIKIKLSYIVIKENYYVGIYESAIL